MSKKLKNTSLSPLVRKGFRTLSRVQHKANLLQLKLKAQEENQAQTKLNSSKESTPTEASASSLTPSKKSSLRLIDLPKAAYLWLRFKVITMIINRRNRPPSILKYPNRKLKTVAIPVDFDKIDLEKRTTIVRKMGLILSTQIYGSQEGIAAPQIGINLRIIIVRGNVMFNPEWNPTKAPLEDALEACYSLPNKVFRVPRAKYGWAKWTNINGRPMESKLNDIPAIVFQHELDHLNGICSPDIGKEVKIKDGQIERDGA